VLKQDLHDGRMFRIDRLQQRGSVVVYCEVRWKTAVKHRLYRGKISPATGSKQGKRRLTHCNPGWKKPD